MKVTEILKENQTQELSALAQYLLSRSTEMGAKKTISTDAFISLARDLGISLTVDSLQQKAGESPLNAIISNVSSDKVEFTNNEAEDASMPVDKARQLVSKMAKRSLGKRK